MHSPAVGLDIWLRLPALLHQPWHEHLDLSLRHAVAVGCQQIKDSLSAWHMSNHIRQALLRSVAWDILAGSSSSGGHAADI